MLRSLAKSKGEALRVILEDAAKLSKGHPVIMAGVDKLAKFAKSGKLNDVSSRDFSMLLSEVYMGALLVSHSENEVDEHSANIWMSKIDDSRLYSA